ncbi:MAG TPA: tRNA epoxyqueuosine(34) reductase QueG [Dehalococcoidia bacterium]|nr:tRNA epoxyqueuosine(34) reductase QueG [Dehalococcoidia bacterium]
MTATRLLHPAGTVKAKARELGFNLVGLTRAEPSPHLDAYFRWIEAGRHGEMRFLARPDRLARREDLSAVLPQARSLVIVGLDYLTLKLPNEVLNDPSRGRIAAYAWGQDYHEIMTPRLEELAAWLRSETGGEVAHRVYVDTGAVLERSHAVEAGLGFTGKNTMLIHPRRGSYFFLGEIFLDGGFDAYDQPQRQGLCGSCTRCLNACPTSAFPAPFVLDARRCISYLTIEHKSWIDPALRPLMGNWVMGCDVCQQVCPWQRFGVQTLESSFFPTSIDRVAPPLIDLLRLDEATFRDRYRGTPIYRLKRDRLVRNACVAAGNWGSAESIPQLLPLLKDDSPLVRGHAAWAISRILGIDWVGPLRGRLAVEDDPQVREELHRLLTQTSSS